MEDPFGEEELLQSLATILRSRGVNEEQTGWIMTSLRVFPPMATKGNLWLARELEEKELEEIDVGFNTKAQSIVKEVAAGETGDSVAGGAELELEESPIGYIISVSGKQRKRRLHCAGSCHRSPGFDYADYYLVRDVFPSPEEYDDFCHQCWRQGSPGGAVEPQAKDDSSVGTEDESSSTDLDVTM